MKKRIITLITFFILISFTSCKTTYECLVCDDGSTPIVKAKNDEKADELCKEKDCAGSLELLSK